MGCCVGGTNSNSVTVSDTSTPSVANQTKDSTTQNIELSIKSNQIHQHAGHGRGSFLDIIYSFRKCKKVFNSFSGNKEYITKSEVRPLLIQLGVESSSLSDDEITRIINTANLNGDNKIDFKEFLIAAVDCFLKNNTNLDNISDEFEKIRKGFDVAREVFDVIDTDSTGEIDFNELKGVFSAMKHDDLILERLKELGFNSDKTIKFPEFVWGFTAWFGMNNDDKPQQERKEEKNELPNSSSKHSQKGFYTQIINATPFKLQRVENHAHQMKCDFPDSISPNSIDRGYAEWGHRNNDSADVTYQANAPGGATIHIHCEYPGGIELIYGQASNDDGTQWVFFPPPSKKDSSNSAKLGWIHDGCLSIGVVFNKIGFVFPNQQGYYVDSYDYPNQPKNYLKRSAKQFGPDWMKRYWSCINNLSLNELTLPGTHDTSTFAKSLFLDGFSTPWVRTQSQDINQQLLCGMRAFDLRLYNKTLDGKSSDRFIMSHGEYKLGLKLTDVLDAINSYFSQIQYQCLILDFHRFNNKWNQNDYDDMITLVFKKIKTANCIPYYSNTIPKPISHYKPTQQIVVAIDKSLFSDEIQTKYAQYLWPKVNQQWDGISISRFGTVETFMDGILDKIQTDKDIKKNIWTFQCAYNQPPFDVPAYVPQQISMYFSNINCIKSNIINIDFIDGTTTAPDFEIDFPNFSNLMNAVPTNILKGFRKRMGYSLISKK